jgi:hypothetical protein
MMQTLMQIVVTVFMGAQIERKRP